MMVRSFLLTVFSVVLVACSDPEPEAVAPEPAVAIVSGSVIFGERIGLTPDSRLELALQDVSLADAAATTIATTVIDNPGQSPIAFTIEYPAGEIDGRHTYSISAKVLDRGKLILISDSFNPAITRNAPDEVRVRVVRVSQSRLEQRNAAIADTEWLLQSVNGRQVSQPERGPKIQMTLDSANGAASGYGGCNRFKGGYELKGNALAISKIAVTAMACEDRGDYEADFLQALGKLDEVRVTGETMLGYSEGSIILSFAARRAR
jgi:putative lipoprotein